jgi:ketoreductase
MVERGWGRIINISSISGKTAEIWGSAYSASKFGMIGLTQALALEVARHNITVNAVCPGWVLTEMATEQLQDPQYCELTGSDPKDAIANAAYSVPQQRMIEPEEVAALVAFLASDRARGITGQAINICGGLSLH